MYFFVKDPSFSFSVPHLWYLPMIIGVYIFIPFVANALHSINYKIICFILVIICIYTFLIPTINPILTSILEVNITNRLDFGFSGGTYGLYIICGYLFSKQFIRFKYSFIFSLIFLSCTVAIQFLYYYMGIYINIWYDNFFLFLTSIFLFDIISNKVGKIYFAKQISYISRKSFSIYLSHCLILNSITSFIPTSIHKSEQLFLLFLLNFILTVIFVITLEKISFLRKFLFR